MAQALDRPFEGREQELDDLLARWRLALEGAGQVVTLSADDGVGKSRLLEVFAERTAGDARVVLTCRCSKLRRWTAFSPLVDLLRRLEAIESRRDVEASNAGSASEPDPKERLRATVIARLNALLSPPRRRRAAALNLNPEGRARKTLEELLGLFSEGAKRLPILLVIEDLDWVDPSTLELLELLVQRRLHVSWMTVLTFTPRFEPPWSPRGRLTHLDLPPLESQQAGVVLDGLIPDGDLDPALRQEVIDRAKGVPLLLEEQARLIRVLGPAADVDSTLENWLSARLAHLSAALELAQLASVIGDEMSRADLAAVSSLAPFEHERALGLLLEAEILVTSGDAAELAFSHGVVHGAILVSMPENPRRRAHRQMAKQLQEAGNLAVSRHVGGALAGPEIERIAQHYDAAGLPMEAASHWYQAAEEAVRSSANLEAAECARRGLRSLESAEESDERTGLEVNLQIVLGAALGTAKGFAAADAVAAYDQALELVWQAPESPRYFSALQELTSYYLARGHISTAFETADKSLRSLGDGDMEAQPVAQRTLGFTKLLKGDFAGAEADLDKSLAPYAVHRSLLQATPPALGVPIAETLSHLSLVEWFLGRPSQALKHSTDSLTLARRYNDPYSRVFTVFRASYLHVFRREPVATRELAHELVGLANRHGFLFFIAAGMFLEGQALAAQGRAAEGLQMMSGGLDGVWASGMEVNRPRNLALLAEACGKTELFEQGLSLVREGIAAVEITGEAHYEPELFRIQGELLRHSEGPEDEIEESFLAALGLSRRQGNVALELRAAISLSRLRQAQGKVRQAVELLAEVYGKFDEGFDTADLKEAKGLLDEIA